MIAHENIKFLDAKLIKKIFSHLHILFIRELNIMHSNEGEMLQ